LIQPVDSGNASQGSLYRQGVWVYGLAFSFYLLYRFRSDKARQNKHTFLIKSLATLLSEKLVVNGIDIKIKYFR